MPRYSFSPRAKLSPFQPPIKSACGTFCSKPFPGNSTSAPGPLTAPSRHQSTTVIPRRKRPRLRLSDGEIDVSGSIQGAPVRIEVLLPHNLINWTSKTKRFLQAEECLAWYALRTPRTCSQNSTRLAYAPRSDTTNVLNPLNCCSTTICTFFNLSFWADSRAADPV